MAEEGMASYLYAAYHPYSYRYPPPKGKGGAAGGWRPRGSGYFSGYGDAAAAAEYFDNYQRAQLKAILSQVNPNLTPRLRKANTKEVGVQVNPRQDASVQCSLGPRTLMRRRPGPAAPRPREAEQELGSPATTSTRAVRFPRTIAVYSPMASRRLTAFLEEPSAEPEQRPQQQDKAAAAAVEEEPAALREQREAEAAAVRASWEKPTEGGAEALGQRPAEPLEQRPATTPEPPAATETGQEEEVEVAEAARAEPAEPPAAPQKREPSAGKTRLRFQFLEQKYGYYHCKACNIRWESAYVWCVQGTNKVYFRQFCRTCQKSYNPYRVEDITCQVRDALPAAGRAAPGSGHPPRPPPSPSELQADAVHLPREDAPRGSQEAPPPGPLWQMQRETPLL
ncbi:zygote arrest protein 1 isoform X3 [Pseudopipra pipra]|uniref:zygote arrest protein 1 isoform X3 n=1 Tax=Pseudopipra pipra TaxID=415032 RepID=UPI003139E915